MADHLRWILLRCVAAGLAASLAGCSGAQPEPDDQVAAAEDEATAGRLVDVGSVDTSQAGTDEGASRDEPSVD